jgi:hypothetical protein
MDWTHIDSDGPPRAPLPRLKLLEAQWRVLTPHGRILSCGIYQSETSGIEVLAGHDGLLICSQHTWTIESARAFGRAWLGELRAHGVEELPIVSDDVDGSAATDK